MQKFCEKCGAALKVGEKFCTNCGATVSNAENISSPNTSQRQNNNSKNQKKFLIAGAVLAVLVFGGAFYFVGGNFNAENSQEKNSAVTENNSVAENKNISEENKNVPAPSPTPAAPLGIEWIQDQNTGIYLKNPQPTDGETITWSGGYVQEGQYKFADGYGVTNWYRYGELKQVDEGTFIKGERNGNFKHKFYPSGNVDYSNWDHGKEVVNQARTGEVYVGNYNDGTPVYYLTQSLSGDPSNAFCTVRAGQDKLDYHFFYKNGVLYYKNSEGYEGAVYGGNSPVAAKIWESINQYR